MYNTICHIEFEVTDLDRAARFYKDLFDWKFADFEIPNMRVFGFNDQHIGGLMKVEKPSPGGSPSLWFRVKDLDAMVAKAASLGGSIVSPKGEVPNVGWSACVSDPDGNAVGMVQYAEDHP